MWEKTVENRKKNAAVERYLCKIRRELPIPGKTKRNLLRQIKESIYEQTQGNTELDEDILIAKFGTPRQIIESYMDGMSTSEFTNDLRLRRKIIRIVFACALAAFLLWATVIGGIWLNHRSNDNGFYEEQIINVVRTTEPGGED